MEELWPDADPTSAGNSLNQSLHFIRRDIDPWYEDDISVDYLAFQGDLLWLDPALVHVSSSEFFKRVRVGMSSTAWTADAIDVMALYRGRFAPEFEYDEWAIPWRSRVHATFLEYTHAAIHGLIKEGELQMARDIAIRGLAVDPDAQEIERTLIWLYWQLGAKSAAVTQHEHLVAAERLDGLPVTRLQDLTVVNALTSQ